jgi:hypothetical protein
MIIHYRFFLGKKRQQSIINNKSLRKLKKPNLIAEYVSSNSESSEDDNEENIDAIDVYVNDNITYLCI